MQLCVGLDRPSQDKNLALIEKLKTYPIAFKVGLRSYIRDLKPFINAIKSINPEFKIFLDLKLYDSPNTMPDAVKSIIGLGVDIFNVLAVTTLTSFDEKELFHIYDESIVTKANQFAENSNAPEAVIAENRNGLADARDKISKITAQLSALGN